MEIKDFIPFVVAVGATFLGFALNQGWVHHREKKSQYKKIISLLKASKAEVEFNLGKLKRLAEDLESYLKTYDVQNAVGFLPSYGLLPNFMDKLKGEPQRPVPLPRQSRICILSWCIFRIGLLL